MECGADSEDVNVILCWYSDHLLHNSDLAVHRSHLWGTIPGSTRLPGYFIKAGDYPHSEFTFEFEFGMTFAVGWPLTTKTTSISHPQATPTSHTHVVLIQVYT